jgi:hypothetical protein
MFASYDPAWAEAPSEASVAVLLTVAGLVVGIVLWRVLAKRYGGR